MRASCRHHRTAATRRTSRAPLRWSTRRRNQANGSSAARISDRRHTLPPDSVAARRTESPLI